MANTAMLGRVLLPEMKKLGYHPTMSMGPILGTGGIAMLIPPSALAVLVGSLAGIPIKELLIAGIVPAIVIAILFFAYVVLACSLRPSMAPAFDGPPEPLISRLVPFSVHVLPLLSLFGLVVGSILLGWATPSESAALGAVGAILAAACYRRLSWSALKQAFFATGQVTVMALFIIGMSITFSQILSFSGAIDGLLGVIGRAQLAPMEVLIVMILVLLVLGCFVDQLSMLLITLPFFMPLARDAGFDLLWYGVILLILLEISFTTPPFGLLLFVMKGVAPPDTTMRQIYGAAAPFILLEIFALIMIIAIPSLATFLPNLIAR